MRRLHSRFTIGLVAAVSIAALSVAGARVDAPSTGLRVRIDANSVAVGGYDPVSYFDGAPTPGRAEITAVHDGAIYRFADEASRDRFKADPTHFVPQYGGFCAYGVAKGGRSPVDPAVYALVDGKLYLNYNADVAGMWNQDTAGFIRDADRNWTQMNPTE